MIGLFPFGQEVRELVQTDRSPKRVFVLGVYASAVHARWVGPSGNHVIRALAVASEPYIFWRGEGAAEILSAITIPEQLGRLEPVAPKLNGPSGRALDNLYLAPMGLTREDVWLCDLVPHSCANSGQRRAIEREYLPLIHDHGLPTPTVPPVPSTLCSTRRRAEIVDEIRQSKAEILLLLGDEPIRWFLHPFTDRCQKLSDFGDTNEDYGVLNMIQLDDVKLQVLPLVHPRQADRLGQSTTKWYELHQGWLNSKRCSILR